MINKTKKTERKGIKTSAKKLRNNKEHIKRKENHDCEPTKGCYTEKR